MGCRPHACPRERLTRHRQRGGSPGWHAPSRASDRGVLPQALPQGDFPMLARLLIKHETRSTERDSRSAPGGNRTPDLRLERPLLFGTP